MQARSIGVKVALPPPARAIAASLVLLTSSLQSPAPSAAACAGFRPARLDVRGIPDLARPVAVLPADFNRDGKVDVAVVGKFLPSSYLEGSLTVLAGDRAGGLTIASTRLIHGGSTSAAVGDFNRDGSPDVAAVDGVEVMSFAGDGAGGFLDPILIPMLMDPVHVTVADMDADGRQDLVVVLEWVGSPTGRVVVLRGDGAGGFTTMTPAAVGQRPLGAAVADFNGDGKLDVVAGGWLSNTITFLPGLGDGTFGPGITMPLGVSTSYLTAIQLDGDGRPDLVVTSEDANTTWLALKGAGDGTFSIASRGSTGITPFNPVVCDFDRDGRSDTALPLHDSGYLSVLLGDGSGGFGGPVNVGVDGGPANAAVADLNGDGLCDVVTGNDGPSLSVLLGGPGGILGAPTLQAGGKPVGAAAADFDHDGRVDLAVANRDGGSLFVYRGDGEGGMSLAQTVAAGTHPGWMTASDLDRDGAVDLIVSDQGIAGDQRNDSIVLLRGGPGGTFSPAGTLSTGDNPLEVRTADFNQDGWPDIVVANGASNVLTWYPSDGAGGFRNGKNVQVGDPQCCVAPADYNRDGILDVAVALFGQNVVVPLMGNSHGGFDSAPAVPLGGVAGDMIAAIAVGDLNMDSAPDLVAVTQSADLFGPGTITVLINDGAGGFQIPQPPLPTGPLPSGVVIFDMDGRAGPDVAVTNRLANEVMVFTSDGAGRLTDSGGRFGAGTGPLVLVAADFNNDTRTDIAAVGFDGNHVTLLLNNTAVTDLDLDVAPDGSVWWTTAPGAGSYNLYRAPLGQIGPAGYGQCLAPDLATTGYSDPSVPAAGQGFFYLVTAVTGGFEGPLGFTSECMKRPSANACPIP